ncbi:MAG: M23 family metallopeptidase [Balneolaceae bacterium]
MSIKTESEGQSINFFAANTGYVDIQMELEFIDPETDSEILNKSYHIIPARTENMLFRSINWNRRFHYRYQFMMGNPVNANHNSGYVYRLPFGNGMEFKVIQGYKGEFTHKDIFAIDFAMPEGTSVHAAREGTVIRIKTDSDRGGDDPKLAQEGNFITILHSDGSLASYVHLRKGGAVVSEGDNVIAGQLIGYSGNTGFSTEPHLHFEVKVPERMNLRSVPVKFKTGPDKAEELQSGIIYRAWH